MKSIPPKRAWRSAVFSRDFPFVHSVIKVDDKLSTNIWTIRSDDCECVLTSPHGRVELSPVQSAKQCPKGVVNPYHAQCKLSPTLGIGLNRNNGLRWPNILVFDQTFCELHFELKPEKHGFFWGGQTWSTTTGRLLIQSNGTTFFEESVSDEHAIAIMEYFKHSCSDL